MAMKYSGGAVAARLLLRKQNGMVLRRVRRRWATPRVVATTSATFPRIKMTSPGLRYHVTVAFRQGYGATFSARSTALDYAEQQLRRLLAEYDELENEDFAGIYCELQG